MRTLYKVVIETRERLVCFEEDLSRRIRHTLFGKQVGSTSHEPSPTDRECDAVDR